VADERDYLVVTAIVIVLLVAMIIQGAAAILQPRE